MDFGEYEDYTPKLYYFVHRICTPSWLIAKSYINFIDLTYVLKGDAIYHIGGKDIYS